MINVQNVATILRALARIETPREPSPTAPVTRLLPLPTLSPEDPSSPGMRVPAEAQAERTTVRPQDSDQAPVRPRATDAAVAPRLPAAPFAAAAPSASIALSAAGTVILEALSTRGDERGPVVRPAAPLLALPPREPALLATALREAVVHSGLFYDSHLARWVAGDYPVAALAREPQAAWADAALSSTAAGQAHEDAGSLQAPASLLRAQIEAHEGHRLIVSAELWPGQAAQLEFEEAGHTRDHTGDVAEVQGDAAWTVRVQIALPSLGTVSVTVQVRDEAVHCRLDAASADAAARIGGARDDLVAALAGHAFVLARCAVSHES
ncbi:MAG: flagellar hook-length control protein FliK [Casimicrobiaceae bacterium]